MESGGIANGTSVKDGSSSPYVDGSTKLAIAAARFLGFSAVVYVTPWFVYSLSKWACVSII